jgi:transposase-like protein
MSQKATKRRHISGEQKVAILRRHLVDREEISVICRDESIQPSMFYGWQKTFFENGAKAFEKSVKSRKLDSMDEQLTALREKISRKDHVISELMDEHIELKKKNLAL